MKWLLILTLMHYNATAIETVGPFATPQECQAAYLVWIESTRDSETGLVRRGACVPTSGVKS